MCSGLGKYESITAIKWNVLHHVFDKLSELMIQAV